MSKGKNGPSTREFRHAISVLKKNNLVSPKIDARSVKPTSYLKRLVSRYDAVVSGKASVIPVSKLDRAEVKQYRSAKYSIVQPTGTKTGRGKKKLPKQILVPHTADERAGVDRKTHKIAIRHPNGIERIAHPVPYHNLEQYIEELKKLKGKDIKNSREYLSINFFGHRSSQVFRNYDQFIEWLSRYDSIQSAVETGSTKRQNEIYRNLEIVRFTNAKQWFRGKEEMTAKRQSDSRSTKRRYRNEQRRLEKGPQWKRDEYHDKSAARSKEYRDRIKSDPKKYQEYKDAAKNRAAKSKSKTTKKKGKKGK